MRVAKSVMEEQKKELEELRAAARQMERARTEERAQHETAAELSTGERKRILATAQHTIESLQHQISAKNEAVAKYQSMLERVWSHWKFC